MDKYHKEIYVDLVKNITCPDWRVRISVCQAIPSFLQYTGDKIFTVHIIYYFIILNPHLQKLYFNKSQFIEMFRFDN